ncbi:MAG: aminotransferase class V-fold PLP-dependent enzyme, partial [Bacillota bacterium]
KLFKAVGSAGKAIEFNAQIGINNIVKRSRELAENLRYRLKGLKGLNIISPENKELSTGIFTFFIENADHELIVRRAAEKNIIIQWRTIDLIEKTKGIRVSLAWFITDEEIETLTDFIEKTIKG